MTEVKENGLIAELRNIAQFLGSGKQAEFYRQMLKDAKPIKVVRLSEVFTETQIMAIEKCVNPEKNKCFRNATLFSQNFPDVKYVEGRMTVCGVLGIEHAWNKIGDKYVDITMELVLKRDPTEEEYITLGEYDRETVWNICIESGYYGSVYSTLYRQKIEKGKCRRNTQV